MPGLNPALWSVPMTKLMNLRTRYAGKLSSILLAFCITSAVVAPAQTFTTIFSFDGANGENPYYGSLVQGTNGSLYGTASSGGSNDGGTIFELSPSGVVTTLYDFCSQPGCSDGENPYGGLIQGTNGNLYGTTWAGGTDNAGTVFEITPAGELTTLYRFCSQPSCTDGYGPAATLTQSTNGNLYGTTGLGGTAFYGTVFEMTPSGPTELPSRPRMLSSPTRY